MIVCLASAADVEHGHTNCSLWALNADEMQMEQERSYREAATRLLSNASHELRCVRFAC